MAVVNGAFTRTEGFNAVKDTCRPVFSEEAVQSGEVDGRKTYKMVERVHVYMPGNGLNSPVFNVTDEHRERWPQEYEAFKRGVEPDLNGIPLEEWAILNKAMVLELKSMHIRTIEDVAGLPDTAVQRIGRGGYALRERAQAFLDQAKEQELVTMLTAKDEKNSEEISVLRRQVEEMGALLESLQKKATDDFDRPNALSTIIPASMDINERQKPIHAAPVETGSSFDTLAPIKRKPGRPKKVAA
jgi:hypothetical protein